ncbi:MAG: T9SS type A sorting domain-containing protein [Bacteroidales bacterium]|nr:T9SS type A sorting domain-containing protein [Bacteroidales bacterium]
MFRIFILLILAVTLLIPAKAQWIQTDGPYGKTTVASLMSDASGIFSTTPCGLFISDYTNEGWNLLLPGSCNAMAFDGDTAYVVFDIGGLKKFSPDNPSEAISCNMGGGIGDMEIKNGKIYLGSLGGGFLISPDHGGTFIQYNVGLPQMQWGYEYVREIYVGSQYLYCRTDLGVYRNSVDPGAWTFISSVIPGSEVTSMLYGVNDTVYVSKDKKLFRSTDNGNTWTNLFTASSLISCMISEGQDFYLGTKSDGVFYSQNLGAQWTQINTGLPELKLTCLHLSESALYCGTLNYGVQVYSNSGWTPYRNGMICSSPSSIAVLPAAVVSNDLYDVYACTDGSSWSNISPTISRNYLGPVVSSGDTVYVSAKQTNASPPFEEGWVLFSNDHGVNWQNTITSVPFVGDDPYRIYVNNGSLYAYENEILGVTSDLGQYWRDWSLPSQYCNYIYDFLVYHSIPFSVACGEGQLLRRENEQWVLSNSGLPLNRGIEGLAACQDAIFAYVPGLGMYVSTNDGIYWSLMTNGFPVDAWGIKSYTYQGNSLFVSTSKGLYYTTDLGGNWHSFNENLPNVDILSLGIKNDTLFAGTNGNGIWKTALASIPLATKHFPEVETSLEVYPNPTTGLVRLNTSQEKSGYFRIFDSWGRCRMQGYLNIQQELDLSGLENGIYQLRVETEQKKMNSRIVLQH